MTAPLYYSWDGDSFRPLPRFAERARKQFAVGEKYRLVEEHERSQQSHNHYFASVTEAWKQLPHDIADQFPSVEHLRKWALCKAGFADERSIVAGSNDEARRIAAFVRPSDPYAVITVSGSVVKVFTAKSQSRKSMGAKDFQASKTAVLEIIAGLVGVDVETLSANAGRAA
jgi:hypothetical protein